MEETLIHEDETLEDLQLNGLLLIQKKKGFRFGMDSVLLSHFAAIQAKDTVADFGSGSAVLPLLLLGRGKGDQFLAFEIQKEMAEMSLRTIKLNGLENRIHVFQCDAGEADQVLEKNSVNAVICNPPYGKPGTVLQSPFQNVAIARSQKTDTMNRFFKAAFRILKGKGKIHLVYPASQLFDLMQRLKEEHLEPKRLQLVYPKADKPANLVLLEAVKDAKPGLQMMPPMVIYDEKNQLTNELKSVYHME